MGMESSMLHTKFLWKSVHRFQRRRFLKGFYHIWAWQPSWSCDQACYVNKFSFPCTWRRLTHKIWLWLAQWFLRGKHVLSFVCNDDDLGTRSTNMTLDLQYSLYVHLIQPLVSGQLKMQMYLTNINSLFTQILLEKPELPNLTLAVK